MPIQDVLSRRKKDLIRRQTENSILKKNIQENEDKIHLYVGKVGICREALTFINEVADARRNTVKSKIEGILTEAMHMIYGLQYRVEFDYSFKANRSNMEIEVVKNAQIGGESREVRRTMEGCGGGVGDTIAVPLRLLVMLGSRQTDKVAILDEAYKHMDGDRIENVANFIKDISKRLGIQIIFLSHHEIMQNVAEKVFQVSDDNGKSILKTF
jgi:ABC-type glutathione transport system ATPase component